ncbi:hypothetical protein D1007_08109 [Hordeum vulgare]|nr:hypothetical protein D1007_08109 [Hordeum vulgare]
MRRLGNNNMVAVRSDGSSPNPKMAVADSKAKENVPARGPTEAEDKVGKMLERLNLTAEEVDAIILEDENEAYLVSLKWSVIGKLTRKGLKMCSLDSKKACSFTQ